MLARTRSLSEDAHWLALISQHDVKRGHAEAEIGEGAKAHWFLVHTYPGDDVRAMRWLARRRFAVYRPMEQRKDKRNGALLQGWQPAFTGWLFVYVFDIGKMQARIKATPGVMRILCDPVSLRPQPIPETFVQRLREEEWTYTEGAPASRRGAHHEVASQRSHARDRKRVINMTRKARKSLARLKEEAKNSFAWDATAWAKINALAPHERIAFLERALNAPSLGTK